MFNICLQIKWDFILISSVVQDLSIIIASFVAINGIRSWQRETKWKRKYELAEEVRSLFYDVQERLYIIRHPMSYEGEGRSRKRSLEENKEVSEILDQAYVIHERFEKEKDPFVRLKVLKYRFMVVFGKKAGEPFDELVRLMNDIFFATNRLGKRYWKDQGRKKFSDAEFEKHLKEMHEFEATIWANHTGEDKIKERMEEIILKVEGICSEVIKVK